jgi:anti-sigma regulatory factor (Ser/Thr protein kinase)
VSTSAVARIKDVVVSARARRFPARMDAFPALAAFAEAACRDAGLGRDDVLRLRLVLEELFTNTVRHGHGGDSDRSVEVALEVTPRKITLVYEDTAPPFDPLAPPASTDAADTVPVGRLGLALVRGLARDPTYERVEGRNRLRLSLYGSPEPPGARPPS